MCIYINIRYFKILQHCIGLSTSSIYAGRGEKHVWEKRKVRMVLPSTTWPAEIVCMQQFKAHHE
jgi:hypothetical protein